LIGNAVWISNSCQKIVISIEITLILFYKENSFEIKLNLVYIDFIASNILKIKINFKIGLIEIKTYSKHTNNKILSKIVLLIEMDSL